MDRSKHRADSTHGMAGEISRRTLLQTSFRGMIGFAAWAGVGGTIPLAAQTPVEEGTQQNVSHDGGDTPSSLRVISRRTYKTRPRADARPPKWYEALYAEPTGTKRLIRLGRPSWVSEDNGNTWTSYRLKPDFTEGLPYGYRRDLATSVVDLNTGWLFSIVNSLDTPGLDPDAIEPSIAQFTYYLRYRVSTDGGRSWLLEEPIVGGRNFTPKNPFEGIHVGKSSFYVGDRGCKPIVTREGKILVPSQTTPIGPDGEPYNPTGGHTYTDVLVLIGTWADNGRLTWKASQRVKGDPARSTRGMIEPTLAEMPDGRILMIMRGSNGHGADPAFKLPSHKWYSVSEDGGQTWSQPEPWAFDDGELFFSPSSMSTLVRHSSGRFFWVGNVSDENCRANSPRWPLVMGEVDPEGLTLIRDSVIEIDSRGSEDESRGRLDLSHVTVIEDRENGEFVVTYPRCYHSYKFYQYAKLRVTVK